MPPKASDVINLAQVYSKTATRKTDSNADKATKTHKNVVDKESCFALKSKAGTPKDTWKVLNIIWGKCSAKE